MKLSIIITATSYMTGTAASFNLHNSPLKSALLLPFPPAGDLPPPWIFRLTRWPEAAMGAGSFQRDKRQSHSLPAGPRHTFCEVLTGTHGSLSRYRWKMPLGQRWELPWNQSSYNAPWTRSPVLCKGHVQGQDHGAQEAQSSGFLTGVDRWFLAPPPPDVIYQLGGSVLI